MENVEAQDQNNSEMNLINKFTEVCLKDAKFQQTLRQYIITPVIKQLFRDSPTFLIAITMLFLIQIVLIGVILVILIVKVC